MVRWPAILVTVACLHGQSAGELIARDLNIRKIAPPLPDKRARWAVVVGVSAYKYAPPHAQLRFAHRDAAEFARLLRSDEGGGFPAGNVRLLTNETATIGGIRAAIQTWLPRSAGPNDVVYVFLAGHAVDSGRGESYFVAHDSDPQNLHATGISFTEVNDSLSNNMRAANVVLFADTCHAGGIGWADGVSGSSAGAHRSLEALGPKDRSFLKVLASRPSEQSFEDERWGGGHGVFTHSVLTALRGTADRDRDGFVRVAELIEYISGAVPGQTGAKQNPRIAGNFDAAMPMAAVPAEVRMAALQPATLRLTGSPNTAVYIDRQFRGNIRPTGDLIIETLAGLRAVSVDLPGAEPFEQRISLGPGQNTFDLEKSAEFGLIRIKASIRAGNVLGAGGAWEQYRARTLAAGEETAAAALIMAALEDTGMQCVSDYVQSTTNALKRPMFLRSAEAFQALRTLRPADTSLEAKELFCRARAHIAANALPRAIEDLTRSLAIEPEFACSYNALGVALTRIGNIDAARDAFERAAKLAPAWALPRLEIARQLMNSGDIRGSVPHLEEAARLYPKAVGIQWSLARVHRLLGNSEDFLRAANAAMAIDRNYAPIYSELGLFYESIHDAEKASQAYDSYLLLAPNYADSGQLRQRLLAMRTPAAAKPRAPRAPPTLRRDKDKKP